MLDSLYENIGGKIKNWAKWIFIVEAIGAVIAGLALAVNEDALYIFIAIVGPIIAWVGSWILYAFGELVDDTHAIRKKMCCQEAETKNKAKKSNKKRYETTTEETFETISKKEIVSNNDEEVILSDDEYIDFKCPNCKEMLSIVANEKNVVCPWCDCKIVLK